MRLSNVALAISSIYNTGLAAGSSLYLDFLSNNQTLDPRITFTRASNATRVNSSGLIETVANNAPRFDYDPVTLQPKGLLIEEQRTNLCLQSAALATLPWFNGGLTSLTNNSTDVLAPDGQYTATKAVVAASAGIVGQPITLTTTTYAGSIWLRCSSGTVTASLTVYLSASPFTNIGAQNITITTSWQRFTILTTTATAASYNLQVHQMSGGTVYLWGAQLEAGAFATSYIPTTAAAATRAADVAVMTGSNFSSWYRQDEGTLFAEVDTLETGTVSGGAFVLNFSDGTGNNLHRIFRQVDAQPVMQTLVGGTPQSTFGFGANWTDTNVRRLAYAYAANNFAGVVNAGAVQTDTSGTIPAVNMLDIGVVGTSQQINGHIRRIAYFPRRLSNSELQAITA